MAATIVLSSFAAFVLLIGIVWFCLLKCSFCAFEPEQIPDVVFSFSSKRSASGAASSSTYWSMPGSRSMSFSSGTITYTGSAKIFTLNEIEKATNNFNPSRILGEGGFGIVYKGSLYDGRDVAVKILKRDDRQSGREFMAEVETLSRLHHRNLVKLIGICIEKQTRCLVYELVPNGSVECHLHGVDKETDPLDLGARMKIALGAARGLAYLHEDSNPCVIHRDFKSSNILLEHDFTPKVSDFGLARTTLEEGNKHISTHVMGTFGYLAPECAMTGHLLVKSDVYSYGVVLLELLTGRKPVDLSQPRGKENLVAWIRPLLTSKEGLLKIIDPVIKPYISLDTVLKVAAIASMCVQPEATQRPFMSEVVQALKLVCSESEETSNVRTRSFQNDDHVTDVEGKILRVPSYRVNFSV
uniref:Receptor-like serine/threonine-protein kinase ALE2 n=3 Tax=Cicer arietinum TaxID=3827 RepID=A0A3Q7XZR7_CICAR|nr:receptor-like serine/threonine-protein kinase ALE2 [Cicer arietinum]